MGAGLYIATLVPHSHILNYESLRRRRGVTLGAKRVFYTAYRRDWRTGQDVTMREFTEHEDKGRFEKEEWDCLDNRLEGVNRVFTQIWLTCSPIGRIGRFATSCYVN